MTLNIVTLFQLWDNAMCRSVFETLEWSFASWLCFNVEMTLCVVTFFYRWNDVVCCDIVLTLKWRWVSWRCFNVEMTLSASSIVIWFLPIFANMGFRGVFFHEFPVWHDETLTCYFRESNNWYILVFAVVQLTQSMKTR